MSLEAVPSLIPDASATALAYFPRPGLPGLFRAHAVYWYWLGVAQSAREGRRLINSRARWRGIATRTFAASTTDHVSLAAAGCAFYATLSLFPAISMLISVYGLVFDPASVVPQLVTLRDLLPAPAFGLIEDRVNQLVARPAGHLTLGLAIAFLVSFWSSASAAKAILAALNVAYNVYEPRPFVQSQLVGLAVTMSAVICAVMAIGALLVLPALIQFSGLSDIGAAVIQLSGFGLVLVFFSGGLALLYAHGPSRIPPPRAPVLPGTLLATVLWLISSWLLSLYVGKLANFDATYGSIGAVVGIMFWFYISAYAVVLGAELNAQLEMSAHDALLESHNDPNVT
jgi:membrane protein